MSGPPNDALDVLEAGPEESGTEAKRLSLRERLLWRRISIRGHYHYKYGVRVPRKMPFGWGVAIEHGGFSWTIAPFPINLIVSLANWAYKRLFLVPFPDTRLARNYLDALVTQEVERQDSSLYASLDRGRAAEVVLRRALNRLAELGEVLNEDELRADSNDFFEEIAGAEGNGTWSVEVDEDIADRYTFGTNTPVKKRVVLPEIDMKALRVGGAYEKTDDDEF